MSKYNFKLDLTKGTSMHAIVSMLEPECVVLEFGPAYGRLTKYLTEELKCHVTIVEIDEESGNEASKYAEKSFIGPQRGDIEKYVWHKEIKEKFDYIIFPDVLEHLCNPEKVLGACETLLKPNGSIIVSVPNIAHNSVIIDLLNDEFRYNPVGLLDDTHIKFFTIKSFDRLLNEKHMHISKLMKTYAKVGENEFNNSYADIKDEEVMNVLKKRPLGEVYQYIYKIKRDRDEQEKVNINDYLKAQECIDVNIYIKDNGEYLETKKKNKKYYLDETPLVIQLDANKKYEGIRIDPTENRCILEEIKIQVVTSDNETRTCKFITNAEATGKGIYLFNTKDPQIIIEDIPDKSNKLLVYLRYIELKEDNTSLNLIRTIHQVAMADKDNHIKAINDIIEQKDNCINRYDEERQLKDNHINNLLNQIKYMENCIAQKDEYISGYDKAMKLKDNHINNLNGQMSSMKNEINGMKDIIQEKENYIAQKEECISGYNEAIQLKDNHITNIEAQLNVLTKKLEMFEELNHRQEKELEHIYSTMLGKLLKKRVQKR